MDKYLLIGSAPYIKSWYGFYGHYLLAKGYILVAMNNAWAIDPENVSRWVHPNDFDAKGHLAPSAEQKAKWKEIETNDKQPEKPYSYDFNGGSGTTILNALVHLLNLTIAKDRKCTVAIAGADCVYDGKETHFYGEGTSDPLRFGEHWLSEELNRVKGFYEKEGCEIYNVGLQERTLLPFERRDPKYI